MASTHPQNPGFGKVVESADMPPKPADFIRRSGLQMVRPYYFDFLCSVKQRWIGKDVIDVLHQEFPARPRDYYEEAFRDGRLRIEGLSANSSTVLKNGQRIRHFTHRHEPPVLDLPVQVLRETPDIVAVGKPPCMPVHVSGQYNKNTVLGVLSALRPDLGKLLTVHRLDKPVSGVLLFARHKAAADALRVQIQAKEVEKVYLARVTGAFPAGDLKCSVPLAYDPRANHCFAFPGPDSEPSTGVSDAGPEDELRHKASAKEALTEFRLRSVAPDGQTSIVECRPRTGRTHQIRVHLQYMGHSIANDNQYGGQYPGPLPPKAFFTALKEDEIAATTSTIVAAAGGESCGASSEPASAAASTEAAKKLRLNPVDGGAEPVEAPSASASGAPLGEHAWPSVQARSLERNPEAASASTASRDAAVGMGGGDLSGEQQQRPGPSTRDGRDAPLGYLVDAELEDELCMNCPALLPYGYPTDIRPLWLHAFRYSCSQWSFECPPPDWANEEWAPVR